mmetsp:Transcript_23561/g.51915  ORF Transcript_23561/g.51915 Transcript_23561/m.51915 type:complete len:155 (+) Transcript_23561:55-519(+)
MWASFMNGARFRAGRLYETFWNSQYNTKWTLVLFYPGALYYVRNRAETQFKYRLYIADKEIMPDTSKSVTGMMDFKNGTSMYFSGTATVADAKQTFYSYHGAGMSPPAHVRVGCHGRMMEDSDNLALAVRSFCKRDPMLVLWEEEADKFGIGSV